MNYLPDQSLWPSGFEKLVEKMERERDFWKDKYEGCHDELMNYKQFEVDKTEKFWQKQSLRWQLEYYSRAMQGNTKPTKREKTRLDSLLIEIDSALRYLQQEDEKARGASFLYRGGDPVYKGMRRKIRDIVKFNPLRMPKGGA